MELLLVSPLGESEIIWGRLRGLWGQFLPAFTLLLGLWAYFLSIPYLRYRATALDAEAIYFFATCYLTLPVTGLYFSLRCRNYMVGVLSTLGFGLFLPVTAPMLFMWLALFLGLTNLPASELAHPDAWSALGQILLAVGCWYGLRQRLQRRLFPLEKTDNR